MAQSGTELFIATGGTKIQFRIDKENELKRVQDELTAQGKEIVNILEGEIKRPLSGWWQEIRVIWKTTDVKPIHTVTVPQTKPTIEKVSVTSDNFNSILERIDLFLEDKNWEKAIAYCESALDFNSKNANIYLKYLLADCKCSTFEELLSSNKPFDKNSNYQKALRFGDEEFTSRLKETILRDKEQKEIIRCNNIYDQAKSLISNTNQTEESYDSICKLLKSIPGYKDADELLEIHTIKAEEYKRENTYNKAIKASKSNHIDELKSAIALFNNIKNFKDSSEQMLLCQRRISKLKAIAEKERQEQEEREKLEKQHKAEKERETAKAYKKKKKKITKIVLGSVVLVVLCVVLLVQVVIPKVKFYDIASISAGERHTVGLKLDGTVVATTYIGTNYGGRCDVANWTDIVAISAGSSHTVGLKSDGTVVAVGNNYYGRCNVSNWSDIVAISVGGTHTVGLKSDGTVVATKYKGEKYNYYGQCDVSDWSDIVAISAGDSHTVGLKSDGTVVAVGDNHQGQCDVSNWADIVAISAGRSHTVGLKSDGTVVAVGWCVSDMAVSNWTDIVAISAGGMHTVGLKSDGTVVATGDNQSGQCNVPNWSDIVAISAGDSHTVGLKSDGTVVAFGDVSRGRCFVGGKK